MPSPAAALPRSRQAPCTPPSTSSAASQPSARRNRRSGKCASVDPSAARIARNRASFLQNFHLDRGWDCRVNPTSSPAGRDSVRRRSRPYEYTTFNRLCRSGQNRPDVPEHDLQKWDYICDKIMLQRLSGRVTRSQWNEVFSECLGTSNMGVAGAPPQRLGRELISTEPNAD